MTRIAQYWFALVFVVPTLSFGQPPLKFYHLGTEKGLSHSWARSITIDSRGYLWVGTISGLNRYDGKSFKVFKNVPGDVESLSDNFIQEIREDSRGNLWVGTYRGGLNLYHADTESFIRYVPIPDSADIHDNRVHCIFEDSKGRLWVGTKQGIRTFDYEENRLTDFRLTSSITGPILAIEEDESGRIWAGTDHALYRIDLVSGQVKEYQKTAANGLSGNHIRSLYNDPTGQLWVGTLGSGLNVYDPILDTFTSFISDPSTPDGLSHNSILCMTGDQYGNLFIGTEGGGINIMDIKSKAVSVYGPWTDSPHSPNSNSIHSVYHDPESQITWFGTYHGGVNYFSRLSKPFVHYGSENSGLANSAVVCITEKEGKIYVGTDGGGLNIIDRITGKVERTITSRQGAIQSDAVLSALVDSRGNLWVGTFRGGLDRIEPTGRTRHYYFDPFTPGSISSTDVSALFEDANGTIWVGTMKGGLNKYLPETDKFTQFKPDSRNPENIRDEFVSLITGYGERYLLIQTGKSLDIFDLETETFADFGKQRGVTVGQPVTTLVDSRSNVWVGTREGLYFFPVNEDSTRIFTTRDGLPSNSIAGILEDSDESLWISTLKGLVKCSGAILAQDSLNIQVYTREDGLQGNEFKDQACAKSQDGTLYFGGQNGLNAFKPWEIKGNPKAPEVVFTGFKLFNKEVEYGDGKVIEAPISEAPEVNLSYRSNVFTIEFSALNFLLQGKNLYAYKMQGFEEEWNFVGNQTTATYTNLNPGTYSFKVKASNNDGIWNEEGASLKITIHPPWWGTLWFRILAVALFALLMYLIFRIRLISLQTRQKILKRQVLEATKEIHTVNEILEERSLEIENQNEELIAKNERLVKQNFELEEQARKIKSLYDELKMTQNKLAISEKMASIGVFTAGIAHEINNPVNFISGATDNLFDILDQNLSDSQRNGETGKTISELQNIIKVGITRTTDIVNSLRNYSNSSDTYVEYDISRCLDDTLLILSNKLRYSRIEVKREVTGPIVMTCRPGRINQVFMNLIVNAIDAIPAEGTIQVGVESSGSEVTIRVADTGTGIPKEIQARIFDPFFSTKEVGHGTGLGLYMVYGVIEEHNGKIEVNSSERGTEFIITLPVSR